MKKTIRIKDAKYQPSKSEKEEVVQLDVPGKTRRQRAENLAKVVLQPFKLNMRNWRSNEFSALRCINLKSKSDQSTAGATRIENSASALWVMYPMSHKTKRDHRSSLL